MSKINTDRIGTRDGTLDIDVKSIMVRDDSMENLGDYEQGLELTQQHQFIWKDESKYTVKLGHAPFALTGVWEFDKEKLEIYGAWDHSALTNRDKEGSHPAGAITYEHGTVFPDNSLGKELQTLKNNSSDYQIVGSFEQGATITERNQVLRVEADGRLYRWAGDLPKVVVAGSAPEDAGGVQAGAWLVVSELALRHELLSPRGIGMIGGISHITPEMFGAIGDGVENDTGAFEAMFESGLKYVLDGSSTYLVDALITPKSSVIYGNGATIKRAPSIGTRAALITAGEYSLVSGVILDGNKEHMELNPTNYRGAKGSRIEYSEIRNAAGHGVWFYNVSGGSVYNCRSHHNGKVRSVEGAAGEDGFVIHDGFGCSLELCEAWENGRTGIVVTSDIAKALRTDTNTRVINCTSYNNVYGDVNLEISSGVVVAGLVAGGISLSDSQYIVIKDSFLKNGVYTAPSRGVNKAYLKNITCKPTRSNTIRLYGNDLRIDGICIQYPDDFEHTPTYNVEVSSSSGYSYIRNISMNTGYNAYRITGHFQEIGMLTTDTTVNRHTVSDRGSFNFSGANVVSAGSISLAISKLPLTGLWYKGDTIKIHKGYPDYAIEKYEITETGTVGQVWKRAGVVASGSNVIWAKKVYQVVGNGGTLGQGVPQHTEGEVLNGEVLLKYIGDNGTNWYKVV